MTPAWWPAIVFGWPAVVGALVACALALVVRRTWLAMLGVALSAPFCVYVAGYPRIGPWGVVALAANVAAAVALRRQPIVAGALLTVFVVVVGVVALSICWW